MVGGGEVYYDNVFDCKVTVLSVGEDTICVGDKVGGSGTREIRRDVWEHNLSEGRYELIKDYRIEQSRMDELEEQDYESYVSMGEVEIDEECTCHY